MRTGTGMIYKGFIVFLNEITKKTETQKLVESEEKKVVDRALKGHDPGLRFIFRYNEEKDSSPMTMLRKK